MDECIPPLPSPPRSSSDIPLWFPPPHTHTHIHPTASITGLEEPRLFPPTIPLRFEKTGGFVLYRFPLLLFLYLYPRPISNTGTTDSKQTI